VKEIDQFISMFCKAVVHLAVAPCWVVAVEIPCQDKFHRAIALLCVFLDGSLDFCKNIVGAASFNYSRGCIIA
jgi:hypothetical protein